MIIRVVLAVEDASLRRELAEILADEDAVVTVLDKRHLLWEHISRESGDIIVIGRPLVPGPESIEALTALPDSPWIVVLTPELDPEEEAAFVAAGSEAVLPSSVSTDAIADALKMILAKRSRIVDEEITSRRLIGAEPRLSDFVSNSPSMTHFMRIVNRVAKSDASLLVLGETGVGKERLARAIHAEGTRADGPFVAVNCGALPESLLESELFGHEKGAFTGAARARRGWFEMAHRGTIFLDEIGELQPHLQVKLLRVLQDHSIQRIGSERSIDIDVRVTAATNRDLSQDVEAGAFRRDLYYRLGVITLTVPPLRERREDIPELAASYLAYLSSRVGCYVDSITPEAMVALVEYSWPGNVRELINVIERALILCEGEAITLADLPATLDGSLVGREAVVAAPLGTAGQDAVTQVYLDQPLRDAKRIVAEQFERAYLSALLAATNGRIGETARRAGIQPRSLYEKMKFHGLRKENYREKRRRRPPARVSAETEAHRR